MIWLQFVISALILVIAAIKLTKYGDAIGYHTKLSGMFIGALLIASATSLPEILTMISSINQNHIDLTAGDLFGSSMFNMLLLGVLDMIFYRTRILRGSSTFNRGPVPSVKAGLTRPSKACLGA